MTEEEKMLWSKIHEELAEARKSRGQIHSKIDQVATNQQHISKNLDSVTTILRGDGNGEKGVLPRLMTLEQGQSGLINRAVNLEHGHKKLSSQVSEIGATKVQNNVEIKREKIKGVLSIWAALIVALGTSLAAYFKA